jgi:hypothetical protein
VITARLVLAIPAHQAIDMKMNPGRWLLYISTIYLVVALVNILYYHFTSTEIIQAIWLFVLSAPLWVPPLSRWVGVKLFWKM